MAAAIYLAEVERNNQALIEGVRAMLINSDDGALSNATATITFDDVGNEGEVITIGGQTYTLTADPTDANDVDIGATADTSGSNLAAAINAGAGEGSAYGTGTVANAYVTAANASGVVTLTAIDQGPAGDGIKVVTDSTEVTVPVDRLTGGDFETEATAVATLGDVMSNNEELKIGNRTYAFKTALSTGPTVPNEILIGATAAETAEHVEQAINAGAAAGTDYSTGTVAHEKVTASASGAAVTITNRQVGSDARGFNAKGALNIAPVQVSSDGDITFSSSDGTGVTSGGTYGDLAVEAAEAANTALGTDMFTADYFDKFTAIDDLSTGPLQDDKDAFVIAPRNGVIKVEGS